MLYKYPTLGPVGGESLETESSISLPTGPSVGYFYGTPNKYPTLGPVNGESLETESRKPTYKAKCRVFITIL